MNIGDPLLPLYIVMFIKNVFWFSNNIDIGLAVIPPVIIGMFRNIYFKKNMNNNDFENLILHFLIYQPYYIFLLCSLI